MTDKRAAREDRWQQIVVQLEQEYRSLPASEKEWIARQLARIADLQQALDRFFQRAGGTTICRQCAGACCARGHNHAGLPTLLAFLQQGLRPPRADFTATCPWLGAQGCLLGVGLRPYSCVTFLCDKLEGELQESEREEFYRLERQLREFYLAFSVRFSGGGMSGLLLQAERLRGGPLLARRAERS